MPIPPAKPTPRPRAGPTCGPEPIATAAGHAARHLLQPLEEVLEAVVHELPSSGDVVEGSSCRVLFICLRYHSSLRSINRFFASMLRDVS